jgi:hypothetical protein
MAKKHDFSDSAKKAAELTNEKLAGEMSKLLPISAADLEKMLPRKADKIVLLELLDAVNSATTKNKKIAALTEDIDKYAGVLISVLQQTIIR